MKTKEELNAIKEEYDDVKEKLADLTDEELEQVTGGLLSEDYCDSDDTDESTALARAVVIEQDMPIM